MSDHPARAAQVLCVGIHPYAVDGDGRPLVARSSDGPWLTDTAGRQFVDWNMGWGSMLLGYRHPAVEAAVRDQLASGTLFSIPHALEIELGERLIERIPCAERVAFGKNGSDVCTAAVRLARAVTGREGVLQYGYHGFHDWCAVQNPDAEGVPAVLRPLVHSIAYGDLEGLRQILAGNGDRIAALIMEPMREELPGAGFLEGVRSLTREHGVVLIFDEMVTGFRVARGGAQELSGVTPDLACLGKAMSNGLPLSVLTGRAELMDQLGRVAYGMTARGESLALAAAHAALSVHDREPVCATVARIGERVRTRFASTCRRLGIEAALTGHPSMMSFALPKGWLETFLRECCNRGLLCYGHLLPSIAHGEEVIEMSATVFEDALLACQRSACD